MMNRPYGPPKCYSSLGTKWNVNKVFKEFAAKEFDGSLGTKWNVNLPYDRLTWLRPRVL